MSLLPGATKCDCSTLLDMKCIPVKCLKMCVAPQHLVGNVESAVTESVGYTSQFWNNGVNDADVQNLPSIQQIIPQ